MAARQSDLFGFKAERGKRLAMMHVCDAGNCEDASCVQFQCKSCGHRSEWVRGLTVSVAKRGRPCPMCNIPHDGTPDDPAKASF